MKINNLPKKLILKSLDILDPIKEKIIKGNVLLVNGKITNINMKDATNI